MTDDRIVRLGVVGLGRAASGMLPSLQAHPRIRLSAAADPNPDARARFEQDFGGDTFADAESLCASGVADAVYIASPHQFHAEAVVLAAQHLMHAIVEKPMALTVEDCERMIAAADAAGIVLIVGHTHAFDPVVQCMRAVIESGDLGRLRMIANMTYNDFLYRPRRPEELDTSLGGGILYNQVPHQIEIARELDGGPLRSVRAIAGAWDPARRTEGALSALLAFEDGVAASLIYSGYDHFDTDEFAFWISESGAQKQATYGASRRALRAAKTPVEEAAMKAASGFAGRGVRMTNAVAGHQPHFGLLIASCEGGDLRPAADGVLVYDDNGVREIPLPPGRAFPNKDGIPDEFCAAVLDGARARHDGRWGLATLQATLALIASASQQREVLVGRA